MARCHQMTEGTGVSQRLDAGSWHVTALRATGCRHNRPTALPLWPVRCRRGQRGRGRRQFGHCARTPEPATSELRTKLLRLAAGHSVCLPFQISCNQSVVRWPTPSTIGKMALPLHSTIPRQLGCTEVRLTRSLFRLAFHAECQIASVCSCGVWVGHDT